MSKVIFVPYIGAFGGVERLILSLSSFLDKHQTTHEVVCFRDTLGLAKHADWPVDVIELRPTRHSFNEARALRRFLAHRDLSGENKPLLFDLKGAFYAGLAGTKGFALHLTDTPSLIAIESSRNSAAYRRWSNDRINAPVVRKLWGEVVHRINRRGVNNSSLVIAMTERISNEINQLYGVQTRIIRPGVARVSQPSKSNRTDASFNRILSVSRLEKSKRLDTAIQALSELRKHETDASLNCDWVLDLAGAGPAEEELKNCANSFGVAEHVKFHGRVSDEELENLYRKASVFVMPAVQGYGLPALEALLRHVPVALHCDSGVSEILLDTPWAAVIRDCDELAPALRKLRTRMGEGELSKSTLPHVPTDEQWAEEICDACGWMVNSESDFQK